MAIRRLWEAGQCFNELGAMHPDRNARHAHDRARTPASMLSVQVEGEGVDGGGGRVLRIIITYEKTSCLPP